MTQRETNPESRYLIIEDEHSYLAFDSARWKTNTGAIDIETTVEENPWETAPQLVSTAVTFDGRMSYVFRNDEWLQAAKPALEHIDWIMHNGLFDRMMMKAFFGFDLPLKHDTMAMQYLLDPDKPKGLQILSEEYLGLPEYKDVDYKNILNEDFEKVAKMNGEDTCRTFNLLQPLADQLNADPALSRVYQWVLMPAVNELIEITQTGIPLDGGRLAKVTERTEKEVEVLLDNLREATPPPGENDYPDGWPKPSWWRVRTHGQYEGDLFNPGSWKQVAHILFDLWGLTPLEWNEDQDGNPTTPSTNADVLLRIETYEAVGAQQEWLHSLRAYRKATKLLSYFHAWPNQVDNDGWLHPRYKPLHVVTGRLSSERPNIQNVPRTKGVRSCFGNVEGFTWMKADYSQIELRLAALAAGEPKMLEAYRNGEDLHTLTAQLVLGDTSSDARQVGKTLNFGLLYGAGPATLQRIARADYGVFFSLDQAKHYKSEFFRAYPGLKRWHQRMEAQLEQTGIARSPLGRVRYLPKAKIPSNVRDMWPQKMAAIREGINHTVQSYASDLLLSSLVRVAPKARELGAQIIAEVHDEIDFLCPDDKVDELAAIVKETMEDTSWLEDHGIILGVPVLASVEVGPNWGDIDELEEFSGKPEEEL